MREARDFMAEVEVAVRRGEYLDAKKAAVTLAEWSDRWLASRVGVRPSTKVRDQSYVGNHIIPHFGLMRLSDVEFDAIQDWVRRLDQEGLAAATVRKAHQILSQILEFAVKARRLRWNPARGVELPRSQPKIQRFITSEEIDRLADIIKARFRLLVLLGGYVGLRWGEAAGLQVDRIDLLHRRLTIDQTLTEVGNEIGLSPPKTAASTRRIALPRFVGIEIEHHISVFPPNENSLLVTTASGTPIRRSNFRRRSWLPAVRDAGLAPLRYHDLRHTHASLLIAQNEHPKLIADRLGHASPNVTNAIYSHLYDGHDAQAAERLDRARMSGETDFSRTSEA